MLPDRTGNEGGVKLYAGGGNAGDYNRKSEQNIRTDYCRKDTNSRDVHNGWLFRAAISPMP